MAGSLQLGSAGASQGSLSTGMINDPDSPHTIMPSSSAANSFSHLAGGRQHTKHPYVTGSSIVGMRCVDGIVLASDTMVSYGSMARFRNVERLSKVTETCVMGVSGEYSDCQELRKLLAKRTLRDHCMDDGHKMNPKEVYEYLTRLMYQRRNKLDPFWNAVVLGGVDEDGKPVLAYVDMYGTNFESEVVATGFGIYLGLPLLRKAYHKDITCAEAEKVLRDVMKVLYYRDTRTGNRIQIAQVTSEGAKVSEPFVVETEWNFEAFKKGSRLDDASSW